MVRTEAMSIASKGDNTAWNAASWPSNCDPIHNHSGNSERCYKKTIISTVCFRDNIVSYQHVHVFRRLHYILLHTFHSDVAVHLVHTTWSYYFFPASQFWTAQTVHHHEEQIKQSTDIDDLQVMKVGQIHRKHFFHWVLAGRAMNLGCDYPPLHRGCEDIWWHNLMQTPMRGSCPFSMSL